MRRALVYTGSFIGLLASMLMGIFAAMGLCAAIFGGEIVDTVLSAKPESDGTHPAFILFLCTMVPGMILGAFGGLFGIVFPIHQYFRVPLGPRNEATRLWLRRYAGRLLKLTEENQGEQGGDGDA